MLPNKPVYMGHVGHGQALITTMRTVLNIILTLAILIILHEFGHYIGFILTGIEYEWLGIYRAPRGWIGYVAGFVVVIPESNAFFALFTSVILLPVLLAVIIIKYANKNRLWYIIVINGTRLDFFFMLQILLTRGFA